MELGVDIVRRLVAGQFPEWSELPIRPVARQGNDNRTFRLGDHLAVRLPSHERYVAGISKEDRLTAGLHSFYRGCHPRVYGDHLEEALVELGDRVDVDVCRAIWREALRTTWATAPVWFHGDVAVGNLLTTDGRLTAVIDFGTCGVGDPACDLVIAWTSLRGDERQIFREAAGLPDDAWSRARGWALWKALITVTDRESPQYDIQAHALAELLADS